MATRTISRATVQTKLDHATQLTDLAGNASRVARRVNNITSHRAALEAHRRANVAWVKAHRAMLDYAFDHEADKALERSTYPKYVQHFDRLRAHWQRCWELGTRRGLSFPRGAPCGRTSDYLLER